MHPNPYSTIEAKEQWLLQRRDEWDYYKDLDRDRQRSLVDTLFRRMKTAGLYSPRVGRLDGAVSLSKIIRRLTEEPSETIVGDEKQK